MDEPTALLPPVSTQSLSELLASGPLGLGEGLELMSVIAGQVAKLHERARTHGLLTASIIRVQRFESGPPVVILNDVEATRDMSEGADLLALGVLAFQVLVGRVPRPGETLTQAMPLAPAAVDKLVAKLLAPRGADRLPAAAAQRQFHDLSGLTSTPHGRTAAPLEAPPVIKRGAPLNPFADDEKTARVVPDAVSPDRKTAPNPPVDPTSGPAMEDEKTQFDPVRAAPVKKKASPELRAPLPPPVMTPEDQPKVEEETRTAFEPSRSDLPGNTGEPTTDPRPMVRKRRSPETPGQQLLSALGRQPPWVWAAAGIGLAFFVLLLIALAR